MNAEHGKPAHGGFFRGVRAEIQKAVWPSGRDVIRSTAIVAVCIAVAGILLALLDRGLDALVMLFL